MEQTVPMRKLLLRIGLRFLLIVVLLVFLSLFLFPLLELFLPFILAFVLATLIAPLVLRLTKKMGTMRSVWSMVFVVLIILALTAILVFAGYYLFSQVRELAGSWNAIVANFTELLNSISLALQNVLPMTGSEVEEYAMTSFQELISTISERISSWVPSMMSRVGSLASGIASFLVSLLFFIVGAYFITADYPHLRQKVSDRIPGIIRPHMRHIRDAMGSAMFGYLKAQLVLSSLVTIITFLALLVWGQEYALLIALLCGIIDLIPFFGSCTILVPWAVVSLFLRDYPKALFLLILALALFLFRKLAEPKVVGNHTGLSPLVSLISIYVGMKLWGVFGMILLPILCMIFIGLYGVGFFDPTIKDFRMLFYRIVESARIEPEEAESFDPTDTSP